MTAIDVSPEMLALVGKGRVGEHRWPSRPVALRVDFGGLRAAPTISFHSSPNADALDATASLNRLILIVDRAASDRVLGRALEWAEGSIRCLPPELTAIALSIRDCAMPAAAATPYRLAKSIELLCELLGAERSGRLVELSAPITMSAFDTQRIAAARKLIDEHWNEKLTLGQIARRCGINRSKLAKGFREIYNCSVSEVLLERRLAEARRQLIATDLPVSQIGYRSGYLNNASFTRAFGRRFGVSPTDFRACRLAA